MLRSLAPPGPPRNARRARAALLACAVVVVLSVLAAAVPVLTSDPAAPESFLLHYVERDGDYVAWGDASHVAWRHVAVSWMANGSVERVLLLRQGDVARLVAGEDVEPIATFDAGFVGARLSTGEMDYDGVAADCPPPTGGCIDASIPVLVWVEGSAWRGMDVAKPQWSTSTQEFRGGGAGFGGGWGPVSYARVETSRSMHAAARAAEWTALAAGLLGAGAAAWWLVEEARSPRGPAPRMGAPPGATTEEMLRLVRLASLYVEGIGRSFLVSALAIVAATVAVLWLGLPPVLSAARVQFAYLDGGFERALALFALGPAFVGFVALVAWGVSYARVRRELREWRDLSARFDAQAADVLGA